MIDSITPETIKEEIRQIKPAEFTDGTFFQLLDSLPCETDQQRFINEARERIKKEGFIFIGFFDDLLKAHKRDQRQQKKQYTENQKKTAREKETGIILDPVGKEALKTGFDGLEDMLGGNRPDYGKYYCSDTGIFYLVGSGEQAIAVMVCSHPLFPSRRYTDIETGSVSFDISYKQDGQWKIVPLVDKRIIGQSRLITELSQYDLNITSENAKEVVKYLEDINQRNRSIIPRTNTISRLGWIDGKKFSPYIEGVSYNGKGKFADMFSSISTQGSFEEWKKTALEIMTTKKYLPARLVLAASVASVLLGWMGNQSFHVHIWSSESGTGKTISQKLAASVWGDPSDGAFLRSMNTTIVAIEQMDSFCNNLPLILDELQSSSIDSQSFIYCHCEGTGKARGAKEGGLREQTRWKNIAITSGEQPLATTSSAKAGAINRVISIETHGQVIPGSKEHMSEFADKLHDNYGFAGKMIIDRIIKVPEFGENIRSTYRQIVAVLNRYDLTGKQANYGAALLIGDALLSSIVFGLSKEQQLLPTDILPYLATQEMVDFNLKLRLKICGYIASETAHFMTPETPPAEAERKTVYGEKKSDGSVLFNYEKLTQLIEENRGNIDSFMRWCFERNMIKSNHSDTHRHWRVSRRIKGITQPVYVAEFKPEFFPQQDNEPVPVRVATPFDN